MISGLENYLTFNQKKLQLLFLGNYFINSIHKICNKIQSRKLVLEKLLATILDKFKIFSFGLLIKPPGASDFKIDPKSSCL